MAYTSEKRPSSVSEGLLGWIEMIVFAVAAVLFLLTFVVTTVIVDGSSMRPTLLTGDSLLATNVGRSPRRGDIIAIALPGEEQMLIKRLIGLPGDEVDIDPYTGEVFVNGRALNEPYAQTALMHPGDVEFPVLVPAGEVFVLGDNREVSLDSRSRSIGTIDMRYIRGRALLRFLPVSSFGLLS